MASTGHQTPRISALRSAQSELARRFEAVRRRTIELCAPLSAEDHVVQAMPDASPTKWHLAHTTWFFEAFVLGGEVFDPAFQYLFNSYYEAVGSRVERARRGMLTRPSLDRVHDYREAIDRRIQRALAGATISDEALSRLELGLHHEQQHQELILTDAKYLLGSQPLQPAYRAQTARVDDGIPGESGGSAPGCAQARRVDDSIPGESGGSAPGCAQARAPVAMAWHSVAGGVVEIGAGAGDGFAFDNELPRHQVLLAPYQIASRPIANAEVLGFIAEGGYRDPRLWLSDGWQMVKAERWEAPLYWTRSDGAWLIYELAGVRPVDPAETACHLSLYEADAIARWLGARLPTEAEWEHAAAAVSLAGNFADAGRLHPDRAAASGSSPSQLFGDVWEWTASAYSPYPGFRPLAGALGEYNGKFMSGQCVLRGGSCLTPADHIRHSYRNFFPPSARWQMTGMRLAMDM